MFKKFISFCKKIYIRYDENDIDSMSASFTYNMLLSVFPFLIFVISVLSFFSLSWQEILPVIKTLVPEKGFSVIEGFLNEINHQNRFDLLSIGVILTIFTASRGSLALIKGMNKACNVKEKRPLWKVGLIAVLFTLAMFLVLIVNFIMIVLGNVIINTIRKFVPDGELSNFAFTSSRIFVPLVVIFLVCMLGYFFLPSYRHSLKSLLPGSIFATISFLLISVLFSIYINHFANYTVTYGSLAGIIIALVWLNLIGTLLLIGAEINMVLTPGDEEPANPQIPR